jgi:3-isopropylmalate/(R)-2-methylmalate dehydratase large subunit
MHAIEKILANASGLPSVKTGEIVNAKAGFAEINDLYLQTVYSFYEMGGEKVWDKDRVAFCFDHYAPCPTIESARNHAEMRKFAEANELTHHFDISAGVCHQVMPEAGVILPGSIVVATDSHTTTHGAFGALGTGVGATDMAALLITGEIWLRVPEIVEIKINGIPPEGVYPKDVILHILGDRKADGAVYKAIAFTGDYVDQLGVAGRMVLCNMALEMGAKTAYMQPNQAVLDYLAARVKEPMTVVETDADYVYGESYVYDVTNLTPQIAAPDSVDNVKPLAEVAGVKVNQGVIGTCTGGRVEDIEMGARSLKGKHLPSMVRLVILPASGEVFRECIDKGYIQDLLDAGATLATPGCGPCLGAHDGVIAPGEVCITASNRNFPGRMGSTEASLYLASPATVAASVLHGRITDPRDYIS